MFTFAGHFSSLKVGCCPHLTGNRLRTTFLLCQLLSPWTTATHHQWTRSHLLSHEFGDLWAEWVVHCDQTFLPCKLCFSSTKIHHTNGPHFISDNKSQLFFTNFKWTYFHLISSFSVDVLAISSRNVLALQISAFNSAYLRMASTARR